MAFVMNQGRALQAIPLDLIYSPKSVIPDWERFNKVLQEVGAGGAEPIEVEQVSPPRGTPIRNVKGIGPRGRPMY